MSLFKTSGIILKISSKKENLIICDVFTYDYGKIKLKTKFKKNHHLDVGFIINFEVIVKKDNAINEIKNIKIKNEFKYLNKKYEIIILYLNVLNVIHSKVPFGSPISEIYNLIEKINNYEQINEEKLIFSKIKIYSILGLLEINTENKKLKKLLVFIESANIDNILKLKGLSENEKKILNNIFI